MKNLDDNDRKILKELVRNVRLSDNWLSRKTGIPLKTVNRKRKDLEKHGVLNYLAYIDNGPTGTGEFSLPQLYIVKFKLGMTRKFLLDSLASVPTLEADIKHTLLSMIGETNGRPCMILMLSSRQDTDILEIFNAEIVPRLKRLFGDDCIHSVESIHVTATLSLLNNYMPLRNMELGKIRPDWPESLLYVG